MSDKVKLSKDGSSIDFVQSESIPTSTKKFRQSPEIEGFYRFIFENDLQKEAYEILDRIVTSRKAKKQKDAKDLKAQAVTTALALKTTTTKTSTGKPVAQTGAAPVKMVKKTDGKGHTEAVDLKSKAPVKPGIPGKPSFNGKFKAKPIPVKGKK